MVRAIEIADLLAKTPAAEKVTQIEKTAPDVAQRQFSLQLDDTKADRQRKPVPTQKTDEAIIHRDKGKKEDGDQKKKKKQSEKKKKSQMSIDLKA
jgi:hypothetical protein